MSFLDTRRLTRRLCGGRDEKQQSLKMQISQRPSAPADGWAIYITAFRGGYAGVLH